MLIKNKITHSTSNMTEANCHTVLFIKHHFYKHITAIKNVSSHHTVLKYSQLPCS